MKDFATKVDNVDSLTAAEFNNLAECLENVIKATGQTLTEADVFQISKSVANYSSHGDFFTDSGSADAYVLAAVGLKNAPTEYSDGMRIRFKVGNSNTGASTVNVASLGVKDIESLDGSAISANDLVINDYVTLVFDSGNNQFNIESSINTKARLIHSETLNNLGLDANVGANDLVIDLKQADGSTDATALNPVEMAFRSSTATSGALLLRRSIAALGLTVPSGATLGSIDGQEQKYYIYALDNSGAIELAICGVMRDEGKLNSTTVMSAASDDIGTLYSTVARTDVPIRLIGYLKSTQATAGTWVTAPSNLHSGISRKLNSDKIRVRYQVTASTANLAFADNVAEVVDFDEKVMDPFNLVTTGTGWQFRCPLDDKTFRVSTRHRWVSNTNLNSSFGLIRKNAASYAIRGSDSLGIETFGYTANVEMDKDDTIDIQLSQDDSTGSARNIATNAMFSFVDIEEI